LARPGDLMAPIDSVAAWQPPFPGRRIQDTGRRAARAHR
jgi:hypothetical protein